MFLVPEKPKTTVFTTNFFWLWEQKSRYLQGSSTLAKMHPVGEPKHHASQGRMGLPNVAFWR